MLTLPQGGKATRQLTPLNIKVEELVTTLPRPVVFVYAFQQKDHITLPELKVIKTAFIACCDDPNQHGTRVILIGDAAAGQGK